VRQHSAYGACPLGTMPTAELLCEPGAGATHPLQGNLTSRVLACPPAACLSRGCPGHEFDAKGLQGCLNTSAPVGTEFLVSFTVFDSSVPANNATAVRSITVTEPCEPGLVWCAFDRLCGTTGCDVRQRLIPQITVDTQPPVVTLALPGVNLTADAEGALLKTLC
jgi:hypothetical protein